MKTSFGITALNLRSNWVALPDGVQAGRLVNGEVRVVYSSPPRSGRLRALSDAIVEIVNVGEVPQIAYTFPVVALPSAIDDYWYVVTIENAPVLVAAKRLARKLGLEV